MRNIKDIRKKESVFSEAEIKALQGVIEEVKIIIEVRKINEEVLTRLTNTLTTLGTFKENFVWRLLRAAKQNHMLD